MNLKSLNYLKLFQKVELRQLREEQIKLYQTTSNYKLLQIYYVIKTKLYMYQ